jgi:hypothetical protein
MASAVIEEAFVNDPALRAEAGAAGFSNDLPQVPGWREWGFRTARVLRYRDGMEGQDMRR